MFDEWRKKNPLRIWRTGNKWTQADVAAAAGVSSQSVRSWEGGHHNPDEYSMSFLVSLTRDDEFISKWKLWVESKPKLENTGS